LIVILGLLIGCDKGGAGGGGPALFALPLRPVYSPTEAPKSAVARGRDQFKAIGCPICHGDAGKGGVDNPNCITGGKINGLTLVKEGYTFEQLQKKISEGVVKVQRKDKNGQLPPFRMPVHGEFLQSSEIEALASYLLSLYPKEREIEDDWDD
jgi:mono/diheme cytochrome c family protein